MVKVGSVAGMYPACGWEFSAPGPDGFRTRRPQRSADHTEPSMTRSRR